MVNFSETFKKISNEQMKTFRMKIYFCIHNVIHLMDLDESLFTIRKEFCAIVSAKNLQKSTREILQILL